VVRQMPRSSAAEQPTVAIVTALFIEKQAVDAMIENKHILHRYKSDGKRRCSCPVYLTFFYRRIERVHPGNDWRTSRGGDQIGGHGQFTSS
jgi:hypothetical protein